MKYLLMIAVSYFLGCANPEYPWAKSQGACNLTEKAKEKAWSNVVKTMKGIYPKYSKHCDFKQPRHNLAFELVEGKCRVYLGCSEPVGGRYILHGEKFVYISEETLEVTDIYDVAW